MSVKTELHQIFCENLKNVRARSGMTQLQVAELLGVTQPTYAEYESGRGSPSLDLVEKLAKAFKVDDPAKLLRRPRRSKTG